MVEFLQNWMPVNASEHGPFLDQMNALVHWLMALLFVGWAIYFVYVLFRFRSGKNPRASYRGAESHFSSWIEGGVALAEVALLAFFAIPAWANWVAPHPEEAEPVQVRVVAQQFAWNVHYPGPDGVYGDTSIDRITATNPVGLDRNGTYGRDDVVSINQLHLPVDRPVEIMLSSLDVIHSFALPQMRVKQDAIPGLGIPVRFTPVMETPEEARLPQCNAEKSCWEIACAQLCGLGHFRMRGYYTIHSQEGFDAWMAEQVAAQMPAPPAEEAAAGEAAEEGSDAGSEDDSDEGDGSGGEGDESAAGNPVREVVAAAADHAHH